MAHPKAEVDAGTPEGNAATAPRRRGGDIAVRPVQADDLGEVIAIDAEVTGLEKADYWYEVYHRYGSRGRQQRFFLVAEREHAIQGFIIAEVRDWEFGSPPCGWVFGISVRPDARLVGVGSRLLAAICDSFRKAGVTKVRTLLARDDNLVMSFFRSQGMMAAPFVPLELDLE